MKKSTFLTVLLLLLSGLQTLKAQYKQLYEKGLQYKADYKNPEGLALFQLLLKADSNNADYLSNAAYFFSKVGNLQPSEEKKSEYFNKGLYLAKKAIKVNANLAEGHYAYALALGRLNENAGSKQKIANAKRIKLEADLAIKLNPQHAGAYHILGRWHRTIAGFNFVEKLAINTLFGGVPEGGSYDAAIACFLKAVQYEPKYILHYYELALTYYERSQPGDKDQANRVLKKGLEVPCNNDEDKVTFQKCLELQRKI